MNFKRIEIRNFQAQKSIDIDFGKHTFVCGKNGTGKTTILDAIKWVLFGKDSENKTQFDIRFYDAEGNISNEDVSVLLVVEDNGEEKSFCRTLKGSITTCSIDGVPYKVTEYATIVGHLVESEERFKLLTDPLYFFTLNWKEQRELLMNFFPVPDDEIVLAAEARSEEFIKFLKKLTPEQIISSNQLLIKTLAKKRSETEGQIKLLKTYIENDSGDIDKYVKEREDVTDLIKKTTSRIDSLQSSYQTSKEAEDLRASLKSEVKNIELKSNAIQEISVTRITEEKKTLEREKARLTVMYKDLGRIENRCTLCMRPFNDGELEVAQKKADEERREIVRQGKEINTKISELNDKLDHPETLAYVSPENKTRLCEIERELENLAIILPPDTLSLQSELAESKKLYERRNELDRMLARRDLLAENIEAKKNADALLLQIIGESETAENMMAESVAFIAKRTQIVATAVNANFESIRINLTDTQKNGTVIDTFEIYRGGVPYSALNQGSRLLVGLELVSFLKNKLGIEAPIMFDDAERYDEEIIKSIEGQTILLKKTADEKLTIIKED